MDVLPHPTKNSFLKARAVETLFVFLWTSFWLIFLAWHGDVQLLLDATSITMSCFSNKLTCPPSFTSTTSSTLMYLEDTIYPDKLFKFKQTQVEKSFIRVTIQTNCNMKSVSAHTHIYSWPWGQVTFSTTAYQLVIIHFSKIGVFCICSFPSGTQEDHKLALLQTSRGDTS